MCVYVCGWVCASERRCLRKTEEDVGSLRPGFIGTCELHDVDVGFSARAVNTLKH